MGINLPNINPFNLEQVNTGINPNDGQGDLLPESFRKLNRNLTKLTNVLTSGTPFTIYVNPHSRMATDAPSNKGINPNTPFKTLQRALIQAAALSSGLAAGGADDLYDLVSIKAEVGTYRIENSPGQPGTSTIKTITAATKDDDFEQACAPYSHFNPSGLELAADGQRTNIFGGLIVPRGVSIIGSDLRKVKIRPIYTGVNTGNIRRTAVLRVTGGSHVYGLSIFDKYNSTESQHNCDCFAFVSRAELELYYQKIAKAFVNLLSIQDWTNLDIEYRPLAPTASILGVREEEYTIVGAAVTAENTNVVESSSPFIFNVSSRSVRGRNGINADGRIVGGFKSMVCANFTGIGLNNSSEAYTNGDPNSIDGEFKPGYRNFHIRAANDAFIEVVSCFAIGYADQYVTESGGEISMTASKSDFGQTSLKSVGYQKRAYPKDAQGEIVALIPPKGLDPNKISIIDINKVNIEKTIKNEHNNNQFRRIYIGGELAQEDIPEYIQNPGTTEETRWLSVDNGKYLLGKRAGVNEQVFLNLYDYSILTLQGEQLSFSTKRFRDTLRNKVSGGLFTDLLTDNNDKRQFYTWEPITPIKLNEKQQKLGHIYIHVSKPPTEGVKNYNDVNGKNILYRLFQRPLFSLTSFEYSTRIIFNDLSIERVNDDRIGLSPSELLWQIQYRIPKEATIAAPPDTKFVIQSPINNADVNTVFWIYEVQTYQRHIPNQQDGLYNLVLVWGNVPVLGSSSTSGFSQNLNFLYPEIDLDNTRWNPKKATSYYNEVIKTSVTSDANLIADNLDRITQYSLTRECIDRLIAAFGIRKQGSITSFNTETPYTGSENVWGLDKNTEDRKVAILPVKVELRRPSMLTALGHAWHYVGYGTGNYQNALPKNHKTVLTTQELINARGIENNGGVVSATGTTSNGDFFIGNQLFDSKGINNKAFNTPKLLTSADVRTVDYTNPDTLASNELADYIKNQSQSFKTSNLTVTGTSTTTNLTVTQTVDFSSASNFSPVATEDKPGFTTLATTNELIEGTDSTKAVTSAVIAEVMNPKIQDIKDDLSNYIAEQSQLIQTIDLEATGASNINTLSATNLTVNSSTSNVHTSDNLITTNHRTNSLTTKGISAETINITQSLNIGDSAFYSLLATKNKAGFISIASKEDLTVGTNDNKAVTPALLVELIETKLKEVANSSINKSVVNIRLSTHFSPPVAYENGELKGIESANNQPYTKLNSYAPKYDLTEFEANRTQYIYLHPYGGNEIGLYDVNEKRWILASLTSGTDPITPSVFKLSEIGVVSSDSFYKYSVYAYNKGSFTKPLLGLFCIPIVDSFPFKHSFQDGVEVLSTDIGKRYLGIINVAPDGKAVVETPVFQPYPPIPLVYTNKDPIFIWEGLSGTEFITRPSCIKISNSGAVYIAGYTSDRSLDGQINPGGSSAFIIKYNADGTKLWTRLFGSFITTTITAIDVDDEEDIYVCGVTYGNFDDRRLFNVFSGGFISKYSSEGNKLNTYFIGTSFEGSWYPNVPTSIKITPRKGFINRQPRIDVVGRMLVNNSSKGFYQRINLDLNTSVDINSTTNQEVRSMFEASEIILRPNDRIVIAGTKFIDDSNKDVYLIYQTLVGSESYFYLNYSSPFVSVRGLAAGLDSSIYVLCDDTDQFGNKSTLIKVEQIGNSIPVKKWTLELNVRASSFTTKVSVGIDGYIYVVGTKFSLGGHFVTKIDPNGFEVSTKTNFIDNNDFVTLDAITHSATDNSVFLAGYSTSPIVGTNTNVLKSYITKVLFSSDILTYIDIRKVQDVKEGNSGSTPISFVVTRTGNLNTTSSVNWNVRADNTAVNTVSVSDFVGGVFPSGTITFSPDPIATKQETSIVVNIQGDTIIEPDERFKVVLSGAVNAVITDDTAFATIINDDSPTVNPDTPILTINEVIGSQGLNGEPPIITGRSANRIIWGTGDSANGIVTIKVGNTTVGTVSRFHSFFTNRWYYEFTDANFNVIGQGLKNVTASQTNTQNVTGTTEAFVIRFATVPPEVSITSVGGPDNIVTLSPFDNLVVGKAKPGIGDVSIHHTWTLPGGEVRTYRLGSTSVNSQGDFTYSLTSVDLELVIGEGSDKLIFAQQNEQIGDTFIEGRSEVFSFTVRTIPIPNITITNVGANGLVTEAPLTGAKVVIGILYNLQTIKENYLVSDVSIHYGTNLLGFAEITGDVHFRYEFTNDNLRIIGKGPNKSVYARISVFGNGGVASVDNSAPFIFTVEEAKISINRMLGSVIKPESDNPNGNPFVFTVTREGNVIGISSVTWSVNNLGVFPKATPDDFVGGVFPSGTVTFADGESTKQIEVLVRGDLITESDERFTVTLSNPVNAIIDVGSAQGVILNDD
jgi:hypothetical protein